MATRSDETRKTADNSGYQFPASQKVYLTGSRPGYPRADARDRALADAIGSRRTGHRRERSLPRLRHQRPVHRSRLCP